MAWDGALKGAGHLVLRGVSPGFRGVVTSTERRGPWALLFRPCFWRILLFAGHGVWGGYPNGANMALGWPGGRT